MAFNKADLMKRAKMKLKIRIRTKKSKGTDVKREERALADRHA